MHHPLSSDSSNLQDQHLPSPATLDGLPYLSAVICESLRMRPNSTPLPRITPANSSVRLAGIEGIPPGVRVNAFQWFVHRDPKKWDLVDEWIPERWLDGNGKLLKGSGESQLWGFCSGPRMCAGSNLSQYRQLPHIDTLPTRRRLMFTSNAIHLGIDVFELHCAARPHTDFWPPFSRVARGRTVGAVYASPGIMTCDAVMGSDPSGRILRTAETHTQKAFGMSYERHINSSLAQFFHSTEEQQNKNDSILEKSASAYSPFSQIKCQLFMKLPSSNANSSVPARNNRWTSNSTSNSPPRPNAKSVQRTKKAVGKFIVISRRMALRCCNRLVIEFRH